MPCTAWFVPREWAGETAFILAGGASLIGFDPEVLRGRGRVIAIKEAGLTMCPWADVLYWADAFWCDGDSKRPANGPRLHLHTGQYKITRTSCSRTGQHDVKQLLSDQRAQFPLSEDPRRLAGICSGSNALNLAALFGAARIVLLGYDMGGTNWDGRPRKAHEDNGRTYKTRFMPAIARMAAPLQRLGVEVINANPASALDCFPKMTLEEILAKSPKPETKPAPAAAPAAANDAANDAANEVDDEALIGSDTLPETIDTPAGPVSHEDVVNRAFEASGLGVAEWNAMPAADRDAAITAAVELLLGEAKKDAAAEARPAGKPAAKAAPAPKPTPVPAGAPKEVDARLELQPNVHEAVSAIMTLAKTGKPFCVRIRLVGTDIVIRRSPGWWGTQLRSVFAEVLEHPAPGGQVLFECRNPRV